MGHLGDRIADATVVLAGSSGNGGGGICAGRHLANRGVAVHLCLTDTEAISDAALIQLDTFSCAGGYTVDPDKLDRLQPDLVIDALIGYGLRGTPTESAAELIRLGNRSGAPILALDVPSGIEADTGSAPGEAIRPALTLALALPKPGLRRHLTGDLYLADLGIPAEAFRRLGLRHRVPFGPAFWIPISTASGLSDQPAAMSE